MEVQKNHTQWVRSKFAYVVSDNNKQKLTDSVVSRLVEVKGGDIFYLGYCDKAKRGLGNVFVQTAYREIDSYVKGIRDRNSLPAKKKFFSDPVIIQACNSVGMTHGKPIVYLLDRMFERFGHDENMVKEVINYVGLRRGNETEYDLAAMREISRAINDDMPSSERRQIMEEVLKVARREEALVKDYEKIYRDDLVDMAVIDPNWLYSTVES